MRHYEFSDVEQLARKAAGSVSRRYRRWGTDFDTALSDIHLWMYTPRNQAKINRWLANTPQQTARIYWSLVSAAQVPAEKLKAERVGYEVDDVVWYSPHTVRSLLPLVADPTYDGMTDPDRERTEDLNEKQRKQPVNYREGGNTLAQVVDIRRAISRLPRWVALAVEEGTDTESAVEAITQRLGGLTPHVGRRRVMSNAQAQALTGGEYDGV